MFEEHVSQKRIILGNEDLSIDLTGGDHTPPETVGVVTSLGVVDKDITADGINTEPVANVGTQLDADSSHKKISRQTMIANAVDLITMIDCVLTKLVNTKGDTSSNISAPNMEIGRAHV